MELDEIRAELKTRLSRRLPADPPIVVAIDGHSASGKSTTARALSEEFSAALLRGDDFYRVMPESERALLTAEQGVDRYYDWRRMAAEALEPLAAGQAATYRRYDWDTGALSRPLVTIEPAAVVIAEGVFMTRPELRKNYTLTVLVSADFAVRRRRQMERDDATDAWLERWEAAERHHLTAVSPPEFFDVVIEGSAQI